MKNTGIDTPATEHAMMMRSVMRPRLTAASVPSASPIGTASSIAPSISSTVGPMVIASSSLTIRLEMMERPRSPRSTRRMYSKNWIGIDLSRPSSRRIAAMVSALASGPAMIIAGSAGTTCNRQKQRKRTPSKAGNEISRRWTICCPMRRQRTGWAKRNARADVDAFISPSAAALRPTCAAFVISWIVTPVRRGVTPNLPIRSGCVLLRWLQ